MKKLGIIGFVMAILFLLAGLVNQQIFVRQANIYSLMIERGSLSNLSVYTKALDRVILIGEFALFGGAIALIICSISAVNVKNKFAIIGIFAALGSILLGLMQATHLFS